MNWMLLAKNHYVEFLAVPVYFNEWETIALCIFMLSPIYQEFVHLALPFLIMQAIIFVGKFYKS